MQRGNSVEMEKAHLHEKVSWHKSIRDLFGITGCILSNEVLDNFPVHQVMMDEELMEVYLDIRDNYLVERMQPASDAMKDYLAELNVTLPKGFRTEINLDAVEWMKEVAATLRRGYVMTIDYGYPSSELYSERRSCGTLLCYKRHEINLLQYEDTGKHDITSHVNFSALRHWGEKYGLRSCGFTDMARFLLALGIEDYFKMTDSPDCDLYGYYKKRIFLLHTLLTDMGRKFKVLIQSKGVPETELSGLKEPLLPLW